VIHSSAAMEETILDPVHASPKKQDCEEPVDIKADQVACIYITIRLFQMGMFVYKANVH
jgi:hypothetical protein